MYIEKCITEVVDIKEKIKVVGINLQKSGLPIAFESLPKMWDKEIYSAEIKNGINNVKSPVIDFGISLNNIPDYLVGRAVSSCDKQDDKYFSFVIPAKKYLKILFNAESFDKMIDKLMALMGKANQFAQENKVEIDGEFFAEVYPEETVNTEYPEMYLLYPLK